MLTPSLLKPIIQSLFKGAKGSHDWEHTERVHGLALHLGRLENADLEIVSYAALLHDIGRAEEDQCNGRICHAQQGATLARELLQHHGLEQSKILKIVHCIQAHRFRSQHVPETLEAKVLFDADKLDSIGAVGIGRAFLFAGELGAKLHNPDIDIEMTHPYTEEDTAYREYCVKLCKVKDRMLTSEGKRLAKERHDFMVIFFNRLNQEVAGIL